jgi:hypothetical protein
VNREKFLSYGRVVTFLLCLFCGSNHDIVWAAATGAVPAAATQEPAGDESLSSLLAGLSGAPGGAGALDVGFILSRIQQERTLSAKHEQMIAALPQDLRQRVTEMCIEFEGLSAALRLEWCFNILTASVQKMLTQCLGDHEPLTKELNILFDQFHAALEDGTFIEALIPSSTFGTNPLFQLLAGMAGGASATPKKKFDTAILTKIHGVLDAILRSYDSQGKASHSALAPQTKVLRNLIVHAENKDIPSLCSACIHLLDKQCVRVREHLNETLATLTHARVDSGKHTDAHLAEVLDYWLSYLAGYESALESFIELTRTSHIDIGWLLRLMSRSYEIVEPYFDAQLLRAPLRHVFRHEAALRLTVLLLATTHYYGKNAEEQAQQYLAGGPSLQQKAEAIARHGDSGINHVDMLLDAVNRSQDAVKSPAIFNEPLHPAKMAFVRLLLALGHYKVEHLHDKWTWPSDDKWVKFVLSIITHSAYEGLGAYCQSAVHNNLSPELLGPLEKYSAGLVKPELIPVILRIAVPVILLHEKCRPVVGKVVNFSEKDLIVYYPSFYWWIITSSLGKWMWSCVPWVHNQPQANANAPHSEDEYRIDAPFCKVGFYVEYIIMHYVLKNLGAFSGKMAIKAYQKLFAHDDVRSGPIAHMLNEYKGYAAMLFVPGPENVIRATVTEFMVNAGRIKRESINDVALVDRCLFEEMLHYAVQFNLIPHDQAATFFARFVALQSKTDYYADVVRLINDIFDQAKNSFLIETGGNVGGFIGGMTANILMWWKGPFFLKPTVPPAQPAV